MLTVDKQAVKAAQGGFGNRLNRYSCSQWRAFSTCPPYVIKILEAVVSMHFSLIVMHQKVTRMCS